MHILRLMELCAEMNAMGRDCSCFDFAWLVISVWERCCWIRLVISLLYLGC